MADEQIIYLSPEEELTNVRERLERTQSKRIILVIPGQTQLRSHVSWRLLHARARELNKDILIISSDRQIRSVVKAAGFKVADSLESPSSSKSRSGNRPGRTGLGGKTSARLRTPPGKILSGQQMGGPRNRGADQSAQSVQFGQPLASQSAIEPQIEHKAIRRDDAPADRGTPPASSTFEIEDVPSAPEFDYHIASPPPVRPLPSSYEDEEPDLLEEDFRHAQSIREAAQKNNTDMLIPPVHQDVSSESTPQIQDLPSTPQHSADSYIVDEPTVELPEQPAVVPMDEMDYGVADISDDPTDVINIEDQGDMGDFVEHSDVFSRPWTGEDAEEEQDIAGPSRIHGMRPRANRTGGIIPPSSDLDEDTELPPVYDQPTRSFAPRQSGQLPAASATPAANGGNGKPQAVPLPSFRTQSKAKEPRKLLQKPALPQKKKPDNRVSAGTASAGAGRPARRTAATQSHDRIMLGRLIVALLIVLVLIPIVLAIIVPSADVTITLPSPHSYPLALKLTATNTSHLDVARQTLPAQTLIFDSSAVGSGQATGSTSVGNASATGNVVFTYSGTGQVIIPTGTIVATKNGGVQFVTQAEAPADGRPTPVQAANAGVQGNVVANALVVIPTDSLTKIEQYNPGVTVSPGNLTVTNPDVLSGGGAGNATTVAANDVNKVKASLDMQLQAQIKNFLNKNVHSGDQAGKPVLVETPVSTPAVGNVASDGTFTETLKLHMTVLVVRSADLRAAASAQLKDVLSKQKSSQTLVPQQPVALQQLKNLSPNNGNSVVLSFTAVGQIAPQISEDTIRNQVFGKSIDNARQALSSNGGIPSVANPQITVSPAFFHWMPFLPQRINVHFKTQPQKATPVPKPKRK